MWRKKSGRNEEKEIYRLKEIIRGEYQKLGFDAHRVRQLEADLLHAVRMEEVYWCRKSRVQWLHEGDKNTKFFHAQTLKRKRRNAIRGFEEEDNTWCIDDQRLRAIAVNYFQQLFTTDQPASVMDLSPCVACKVDQVDNGRLIAQITDMEIEIAIHQMHPMKSPGPDGFNAGFFHHHWETV